MYCKLTGDGSLHYVPAETSPTGERLEAPCVFEHNDQRWWSDVKHNDWIERISSEEYHRQVSEGQPGEAEGEASETDAPTPQTPSEKAAVARAELEGMADELRADLPDERPDDDAEALTRILYELLEDDDYNARRGVLASVSEYPASGGAETIERRLYAELYDRQLAEG